MMAVKDYDLIMYVIITMLLYIDINNKSIGKRRFPCALLSRKNFNRDCRQDPGFYGLEIDGETEITVACGATAAMISALLATVDPGGAKTVSE